MQTVYSGVNSVHLHCKDLHCIVLPFVSVSHISFQAFSTQQPYDVSKLRLSPCLTDEINAGEVKCCSESGFVSMANSPFHERQGHWKEDIIVL